MNCSGAAGRPVAGRRFVAEVHSSLPSLVAPKLCAPCNLGLKSANALTSHSAQLPMATSTLQTAAQP